MQTNIQQKHIDNKLDLLNKENTLKGNINKYGGPQTKQRKTITQKTRNNNTNETETYKRIEKNKNQN